jgi:iron(III) transport system ATP-binding protein
VAGFVGRGAIVGGQVVASGADRTAVSIAGETVTARSGVAPSGRVRVLLRPEALELAAAGLPAAVASTVYRGPVHEVRLLLSTGEEIALDAAYPPAPGERVHVAVSDAWIIPGG